MFKSAIYIALTLIVGILVGHIHGEQTERSFIANECRQAGAFTNKRTGFFCGVKRDGVE